MTYKAHEEKNKSLEVEITAPDYWGDETETSLHIILTMENEQRSQRVEDWEHSSDPFGALADIVPETMRDAIEDLIDEEILNH